VPPPGVKIRHQISQTQIGEPTAPERRRDVNSMPADLKPTPPHNFGARQKMTDYSAKDDLAFQRDLLEAVPHLRAYARSLARNVDLADDLVHEVVVKALAAADQFTPGTNFRAWVFTILRHQYLNESRKWQNRTVLLQQEIEQEHGIRPPQQAHMEFLDFRRAFWQLAPDQREVLMLVGASGLSYEQAALICDCPVGTIKSRLSRARSELKRILSEDAVETSLADLPEEEKEVLAGLLKPEHDTEG
jgi:RNA polymerase sigma-70 factor (ECF subfamily)